jgi:hypothetical protein
LRVIDRVTLDSEGGFNWDGVVGARKVAAGVYCARVTDIAGRSSRAAATVSSR